MSTGLIIVLVIAGLILIDRLANPVVRAASKTSSSLIAARVLALLLPEGKLLNVSDMNITQIGEALLLDGEETRKINPMLINLMAEKAAGGYPVLQPYTPVIDVVGSR